MTHSDVNIFCNFQQILEGNALIDPNRQPLWNASTLLLFSSVAYVTVARWKLWIISVTSAEAHTLNIFTIREIVTRSLQWISEATCPHFTSIWANASEFKPKLRAQCPNSAFVGGVPSDTTSDDIRQMFCCQQDNRSPKGWEFSVLSTQYTGVAPACKTIVGNFSSRMSPLLPRNPKSRIICENYIWMFGTSQPWMVRYCAGVDILAKGVLCSCFLAHDNVIATWQAARCDTSEFDWTGERYLQSERFFTILDHAQFENMWATQ